jgi:hypothetical protein
MPSKGICSAVTLNRDLFDSFPLWATVVENLVNMEKLHELVYPLRSMDNIKFESVSHLPLRIAII